MDLSPAIRVGRTRSDLEAYSHTSVVPRFVLEMVSVGRFRTLFPRSDPGLMWVSLRLGDDFYKLRRLGGDVFRPSLFDLAADPGETTDLYDLSSEVQKRALERLAAYRARLVEGYRAVGSGSSGVAEAYEEELLRGLGYVE